MTQTRDIERLLDTWLGDDGSMLPDRVIDASLAQIDTTPQRRVLIRVPWRIPTFNNHARMALTAVAAVVVVVGGIALLRPGTSSGPGGAPSSAPSAEPSPSVSPSPSTAPSPAPSPVSTSGWLPFSSDRYGYQIRYPPTSTGLGAIETAATMVTPASRDWSLETDKDIESQAAFDRTLAAVDLFVLGPDGSQIYVYAFAASVPPGMSEDEWLTTYYEGRSTVCSQAVEWQPITIDGRTGRLDVNDRCADEQAFVFFDGRVYSFGIGQPNQRALLEAFLSTVRFSQ